MRRAPKDVRRQLLAYQQNVKARQEYWQSRRERSAQASQEPARSAPIDADDTSKNAEGSANDQSFTNVQEAGVDEADFVKIGANHIFVATTGKIEVLNRATLEFIEHLDITGLSRVQLFADNNKLAVVGESYEEKQACHTVKGQAYQNHGTWRSAEPAPNLLDNDVVEQCYSYGTTQTHIKTYSTENGQASKLIQQRTVPGNYRHLRYLNGRVVIVSTGSLQFVDASNVGQICSQDSWCYSRFYSSLQHTHYPTQPFQPWTTNANGWSSVAEGETVPENPILQQNNSVSGISCNKIGRPSIGDLDFRLTKVTSISVDKPQENPKVVATLGGGDEIYMMDSGLFLAKQGLHWVPWTPPSAEEGAGNEVDDRPFSSFSSPAILPSGSMSETLVITKIAYRPKSGDLDVEAIGTVPGRIKGQWAFKAYSDSNTLAVATTTWEKFRPETTTEGQHNHLWILKPNGDKLEIKASINDFGPREDIRAVRYRGDRAYVVTFRTIDPLFAFDLANPLAPQMLGALKIPGFSMYLHDTSEDRLVGVGYDGGVQVSLFDTSDPQNMQRLDAHIIGERGSYTDITGDHKAFWFNAEHRLVGIPVVEKKFSDNASRGGWQHAGHTSFSGAVIYRTDATNLQEVARISHGDIISEACLSNHDDNWHWWSQARRSLDINRLYEVDGRLLSVSRFGVKSHDISNPDIVSNTVKFGGTLEDCATY